MINILGFSHTKLNIENWQIKQGESCVVLGRNGAGKQYLDKLLTGELTPQQQQESLNLPLPKDVALISHESMLAVYEYELKIDQTDITDEIDFGTQVKEFLPQNEWQNPIIDSFNLRHRMNTGFRLLSSGEGRKLFVVKALLENKHLIVLDNPFDELDLQSRVELSHQLNKVSELDVSVLLVLNNPTDIPNWIKQYALLKDTSLNSLQHLTQEQALNEIAKEFEVEAFDESALFHYFSAQGEDEQALVEINDASVVLGGETIFDALSLTIQPHQHTLITGPNGCGKSTLLGLITGENPQCFSNDVVIVGYKRGSGETIWDVKKHLGIVSPDLHRNYRINCTALTVVASGFKDSIGLYSPVSGLQKQTAIDWLKVFNLVDKSNEKWQSLSYGEQRLVLIARALVKQPKLLVLDEPTQGLDQVNRALVLNCLDKISALKASTIVMVSHRVDEQLALFSQRIEF